MDEGSQGGDGRDRDDRRDGALDVPVRPVADGITDRRRAGVVLSAAVVVVVVAIGLALLPPKSSPAPNADFATQGLPGPADLTLPTGPLPSPSVAAPRASSSRHEALLPLANEPLAGAPNPVLIERRGNDAHLVAWNPGDPLRDVRTFANAFGSDTEFAFVSPDAASLFVATVHPGGDQGLDTARLMTASGGLAWEGGGLTAIHGVAWSSDSRMVAIAGASAWVIVTINAAGAAESRSIVVGERASAASPFVEPGPSPSGVEVDLVPVGFSVDGRWLYGAPILASGETVGPTVRVSIPDGTVESISGAATSGPARLAPDDGLRRIDATTGRTIRWGPNGSFPGGPPTIEVAEADGSLAYRVETRVVLGTAWEVTGELLILEADGIPYPTQLRLLPIASDGTVGLPVISTGPVDFGGLLGVRDGVAILAFGTRTPTNSSQLVAVNLADRAAVGLTLPAEELDIRGASLLP